MMDSKCNEWMNGITAIKAICVLCKRRQIITLQSSHSLGIIIPFLGINEFFLRLAEPSGALRSTQMRSSAPHRLHHCDRVHRYNSHNSGPDIPVLADFCLHT